MDGTYKQIFGWETDAIGEEYKTFLGQFIPELIRFIECMGIKHCSYFHVSDEPGLKDMDVYQDASNILAKYLYDFPVIDALSDFKFYEMGIIKSPIPATDHIEPFLEHGVPNLWTYYCCGQYREVGNRFFNFPSSRNRILGIQLYKFNIKGFLHWGFNSWYASNSRYPVDPFRVSDAGYALPSGDAFVVYPGKDGPLESLRLDVLTEALQDLRALRLLEGKIGRDAVLKMLEEGLEKPITFKQYPLDPQWILLKREQINKRIIECN